MNPALYLKAVVGTLLAGLGCAYIALNDNTISPQEWIQIAQVSLTAFAGIYGIPNASTGKRVAP